MGKDFIAAVIQDGAGGKARSWALEQWKEGNIGPAYTYVSYHWKVGLFFLRMDSIRDPENSLKVWTVADEVERSLGEEYVSG